MGDTALKRLQLGLEGQYTPGGTYSATSTYNGGSTIPAVFYSHVLNDVGADVELVYQRLVEAGTYAGIRQQQMQMRSAKGKFGMQVYVDDLVRLGKMAISGAPTWVTLPNTPQALLAATAIAASMTLTTQPNATSDSALSKKIAITLSNATTNSTAVTITLTGTSQSGASLTEQVAFTNGIQTTSAQGGGSGALTVTLWSVNYFATITSVTTSAQPSGDQVAIAGINGFQYTFVMDMLSSTLYSATGEYFDGSAAWQLPGLVLDKLDFNAQIGKEFKTDVSFQAKDKTVLAATAKSITPAATAGTYGTLTNLTDNIFASVSTVVSRFYADPIGTTPGTTAISARLLDYKMTVDPMVKLGKAADGTPNPTFVGRGAYGDKVTADFSLLWNSITSGTTYDPTEVGQFLAYGARTVRCAFAGAPLPCGPISATGSGWPASLLSGSGQAGVYGIAFDLAGTYTKMTEHAAEERAAFQFTMDSQIDYTSIGAPLQVLMVARISPNE